MYIHINQNKHHLMMFLNMMNTTVWLLVWKEFLVSANSLVLSSDIWPVLATELFAPDDRRGLDLTGLLESGVEAVGKCACGLSSSRVWAVKGGKRATGKSRRHFGGFPTPMEGRSVGASLAVNLPLQVISCARAVLLQVVDRASGVEGHLYLL